MKALNKVEEPMTPFHLSLKPPADLLSPTTPLEHQTIHHPLEVNNAAGASPSPKTPKPYVFNPYSPSSHHLLLAPICKHKKRKIDSRCLYIAKRLDFDMFEIFKTPNSKSLLTGVAETCPGAPIRPRMKRLFAIDLGLCRNLELT